MATHFMRLSPGKAVLIQGVFGRLPRLLEAQRVRVRWHDCVDVPFDVGTCDHLEEAVLPYETWGKNFVVARTHPLGSEPNVIRIYSGGDDNTIRFNPQVASDVTLNSGQYYEFQANENFHIVATEPLLIGQFIVGSTFGGSTTDVGDPSLCFIVPVDQYRSSYLFITPDTYTTSYVSVTASTGDEVSLDGVPIATWTSVGTSSFSTSDMEVEPGAHTISSDHTFGIIVYGFAPYTSYAYPGGLDLNMINGPF